MRPLIFTIATGLVFLGACTKPAPPVLTNSQVEESIENRFRTDAALSRMKLDADANVAEQKMTISGSVATQAQRTHAVELAQTERPGYQITDKIDVKPDLIARTDYTEDMAREARQSAEAAGSKIGASLDDAWIHTKLAAKFAADKDTPSRKINIDVLDNVVTLRGQVDSLTAKEEAGRIATETEGVKRVRNMLTVGKG